MPAGESLWPDGMTTCDWVEIAGLMAEFERENRVSLEITLTQCGSASAPDLCARVKATSEKGVGVEPVCWGSAQYRARRERFRSLKGLCIYLLYQMDFLLEQSEEPSAE